MILKRVNNLNLVRSKEINAARQANYLKMELFFNDMVEEIALEVYFELHRAVKLGYFDYCYPEEK